MNCSLLIIGGILRLDYKEPMQEIFVFGLANFRKHINHQNQLQLSPDGVLGPNSPSMKNANILRRDPLSSSTNKSFKLRTALPAYAISSKIRPSPRNPFSVFLVHLPY